MSVTQLARSEEFEADCNVNVKNEIVKILLSISTITYPKGYFVEDKISRITQLFHGSIRHKLRNYLVEEEERKVLKKELGLTYIEIDRLQSLFSTGDKANSLEAVLSIKERDLEHMHINQEDFAKELEYADSNGTGYIT